MQIKDRIEDDLDVEAWVEQMIAEHGYAQISMHDPASDLPGFAFTVGLEQSRLVPELFCMGVSPDVAAQLFAICIEGQDARVCDIAKGDQRLNNLLEGYTLGLRRADAPMVLKANTVRPRRGADISRMMQLLLPDNDGYLPGDANCDPRIAAAQDPDRLITTVTN